MSIKVSSSAVHFIFCSYRLLRSVVGKELASEIMKKKDALTEVPVSWKGPGPGGTKRCTGDSLHEFKFVVCYSCLLRR